MEASDLETLVIADTQPRTEGAHGGEGEGEEGEECDESLHAVLSD